MSKVRTDAGWQQGGSRTRGSIPQTTNPKHQLRHTNRYSETKIILWHAAITGQEVSANMDHDFWTLIYCPSTTFPSIIPATPCPSWTRLSPILHLLANDISRNNKMLSTPSLDPRLNKQPHSSRSTSSNPSTQSAPPPFSAHLSIPSTPFSPFNPSQSNSTIPYSTIPYSTPFSPIQPHSTPFSPIQPHSTPSTPSTLSFPSTPSNHSTHFNSFHPSSHSLLFGFSGPLNPPQSSHPRRPPLLFSP